MIYLKKGQPLSDNPGVVVYDSTGYYNDGDSIICSSAITPDEPAVRFEARFVAYGSMVYSISDPDELLAEIIKIDPKSLFGKDSQQVAVDKIVEDIVPQAEGVVPTEETEVPTENETATTTPPVTTSTSTSTTTPTISTTTPSTTASTTPDSNFTPDTTSTTTPVFNVSTNPPESLIPDVTGATTTPPEILFSDTSLSTTTPNVILPDAPSGDAATISEPTIIEDEVPIVVPPVFETPTNTGTTTDEVVAFAKKIVKNKISKSLGL